jgi:hypothetical protein
MVHTIEIDSCGLTHLLNSRADQFGEIAVITATVCEASMLVLLVKRIYYSIRL